MPRSLRFTLLTALMALSTLARADLLIMTNGDRLSGTAVRKSGEWLTFDTSYGGKIKVKWADVAELHTDAPVTVVLDDERTIQAQHFAQTGSDQAVSTSQVTYVNPPPAAGADALSTSGRLNIGLSMTSGNTDTQTYHVDGEAVLRKQDDRLTLGVVYNEASDSGTQSVSNATLKAKYDHFISERWYGYGNAKLQRDKFRDLKLRRELGAGLGHQIYDRPDLKLALEAGLSHISDDYYTAPDDSGLSFRWATNYEQQLWRDRLTAFHNHELTIPVDDTADFLANAKTGVRIPVANGLTTTVEVDVDYDNRPAAGNDKTDLLYLFTLGYNW